MSFTFGTVIVVVQSAMAERPRSRDLVNRTGRRPATPLVISKDKLVSRLHTALNAYVTSGSLGRLWVGIEIVLDRREGIILQPDITFIVDGRQSIVSDRVWGPPDMVLELTSALTHAGQLQERVAWFSLYGVREYWLVHAQQEDIAILELAHGGVRRRTLFDAVTPVRSPLFPQFNRSLGEFLI